jgi:hypothetical protein
MGTQMQSFCYSHDEKAAILRHGKQQQGNFLGMKSLPSALQNTETPPLTVHHGHKTQVTTCVSAPGLS